MYRIMLYCNLFSGSRFNLDEIDIVETIQNIRRQRTAVLNAYPLDEILELNSSVHFMRSLLEKLVQDELTGVEYYDLCWVDILLSAGPTNLFVNDNRLFSGYAFEGVWMNRKVRILSRVTPQRCRLIQPLRTKRDSLYPSDLVQLWKDHAEIAKLIPHLCLRTLYSILISASVVGRQKFFAPSSNSMSCFHYPSPTEIHHSTFWPILAELGSSTPNPAILQKNWCFVGFGVLKGYSRDGPVNYIRRSL
ncbi:hypothetical protein B0H13DRAFT_1852267 [Mycena leptocephala]|nr:hypothetical protein B0H13DRAFT_1852267 [Mycena leptocephala]